MHKPQTEVDTQNTDVQSTKQEHSEFSQDINNTSDSTKQPEKVESSHTNNLHQYAQNVYHKAHKVYDHAHDKAHEYYTEVQTYAAQMKGKTGVRRIINALGYSWDGVKAAYDEAGFRQLIWINGTLVILALILPFNLATQLVLILASCMSLVIELVNTGIEAAVDHTSQEQHALAKRAKDVGSAAQYLTLFILVLMWLLALFKTF